MIHDAILFVHLVSVSVWVGGQIVLGPIVSRLRVDLRDALPVVARSFGLVAWPALGAAVISGGWLLWDVDVADAGPSYQRTLAVKLALVALSGAAAAIHSLGTSRVAKAAGASVALVASLGALWAAVALG